VTPDGRRALSASNDKKLKLWDLDSGRQLRTLEGHSDSVTAVAVTPDGSRALSASRDNTLKLWDLRSGDVLTTFHCDAPVLCCAFAANHRIVAGDAGGRLYFLSLEE
jgi:WD40 repeat protein